MQAETLLNSSTVGAAAITTDRPKQYHRTFADYRALEHALQDDDLSAARDAFDRLQQDAPYLAEMLSRDPFPYENRRLCALKQLGECLQTGDLSGAHRAADQFQ